MNTENIQKLISSLKGEIEITKDVSFSMHSWINQSQACIAGHIYILQAGSIDAAIDEYYKIHRNLERGFEKYIVAANAFLELDDIDEAAALFMPHFFYDIFTPEIQKEEAIAVLEKLASTGKVEWNARMLDLAESWRY